MATACWSFIFHRSLVRTTQFARKYRLYILILILTLFAAEVFTCWTVPQYQILVNHKQTQEFQQRLEEVAPASTKLMEQQREIEKLKQEIERLKSLKETPLGGVVGSVGGYAVGACPAIKIGNPLSVMKIIGYYSSGHPALDLSAGYGTPVFGSYEGIVSSAGWHSSGYGNSVFLNIGGVGSGLQLRFGHLSSISVRKGQIVGETTVIGKVGSSGNSLSSHLHFEVWCDGARSAPAKYFAR